KNRYFFHYVNANNLTYMCMCDNKLSQDTAFCFLEEIKKLDPIKTFEGKSRFIKKKLPKPDMTLCSFGESRLLNVDVKKSGDRSIIFAMNESRPSLQLIPLTAVFLGKKV
ncbi:MAG: hypothetical protein ACK4ZI_19160, partial [Microcystis sp.]|uniref:hypothetical protein n=1 Tax=Microcystis sp. TaxID=1127 RepID=UPI003918FE77